MRGRPMKWIIVAVVLFALNGSINLLLMNTGFSLANATASIQVYTSCMRGKAFFLPPVLIFESHYDQAHRECERRQYRSL